MDRVENIVAEGEINHYEQAIAPFVTILSKCVYINECVNATSHCDANANCTNMNGSFTCLCNPGYTGNGTHCAGMSIVINHEPTEFLLW